MYYHQFLRKPARDITVTALIPSATSRQAKIINEQIFNDYGVTAEQTGKINSREALKAARLEHDDDFDSTTRFTVSHEQNGSAAAIVRSKENNNIIFGDPNKINKNRFANDCGVDIVLPSRIAQTRRRWGTKVFSERWLGRENVFDLARFLSDHHRKKTTKSNILGDDVDPIDVSSSIIWGWRESLIKAFCDYDPSVVVPLLKSTQKKKDSNNHHTSTFSMQDMRLNKFSILDEQQENGVTIIRCHEMILAKKNTNFLENKNDIVHQKRYDYLFGKNSGSGSVNRVSSSSTGNDGFLMEAVILENKQSFGTVVISYVGI